MSAIQKPIPNRYREFTLKSLISWYVFFIVVYVGLKKLFPEFLAKIDNETLPIFATGLIVVDIAWIWYYSRRTKITLSNLVGIKHFRWQQLWYAHLVIPLLTASIAFIVILDYYFPALAEYAPAVTSVKTPFEIIGTFLLLVVIAPIVEEILFRKVMLHGWSNRWRVGTSLVMTAILFAILHFDIFGALLFGVVLGILYIKTRNVITGVVIHALNNLWVFVIMIQPHTGETASVLSLDELMLFFGVLAIDLIWIGLAMYIFWPKDWSLPDEEKEQV